MINRLLSLLPLPDSRLGTPGKPGNPEIRQIDLNGTIVPYTLVRRKRRTIGIRIDDNGLMVTIPLRESLRHTHTLLQEKADWILQKLEEWQQREPALPIWEEDTIFPLMGQPWQLAVIAPGEARMVPIKPVTTLQAKQLVLPLPPTLTAEQIEKTVMHWYHGKALPCFDERITLYADKLGIPRPRLKLSHARTQWGSCNTRGIIHLNWRLVRMPLHLIDYVVAHELSHLIEMNHSPAFWKTVESIYPDYRNARRELNRHT